jgi:tetratricopeptide (TPR) repeat protein
VHRLFLTLIALSLARVVAAAPGVGWTRVATPHFVVSGDAPAGDIRQVALRLELLHAVFARLLPGARAHALLPTFVIAFGTDKSFRPYQPADGGGAVPADGYAIHDPMAPCMVLRLDRSDDSFRTIVHEYAHVLFDAPWKPLWLSEGVADYYSTTTLSRDRRRAVVGDRIPEHLAQASRWWVPLSRVVSMSRAARISNDDAGMSFYAESWLLVHYLSRATPARGAQITRFLQLVAGGKGEADAFDEAIGALPRVEADLRRYLANGIITGDQAVIPEQLNAPSPRVQAMTDAGVESALARLLFQLRRDGDAEARLDSALRIDPDLAEAHATVGLMRLRQQRPREALASFRRASEGDPTDPLAAYHYARLALQASDAGSESPLEDACRALNRVVAGSDAPAELLAVLGISAGRLGRLDEAESALRRAVALVPMVEFTPRLELANVCLRVGKFDEAREILASLGARPEPREARLIEQHRAWLSLAEARALIRDELAAAAGFPKAGRDAGIERTGSFPAPPSLRTPGAGEERALGLLDAVDCEGPRFVVRVATRSGPFAAVTTTLPRVHLSSARDDVSGALACGPRARREAVYVTWKGDHELVALEFLPRGYQPGP